MVEPTAAVIEQAIRPNTNIIFTESPTNPYLRVLAHVLLVDGRTDAVLCRIYAKQILLDPAGRHIDGTTPGPAPNLGLVGNLGDN